MTDHACRFCAAPLTESFADLGMSPLSNAFLRPEQVEAPETFYPLHARVCGSCFLVQLPAFEAPTTIFSDYLYFSSYSESWLHHAETFATMAVARFGLGSASHVVEIASNDGYLLQFFQASGIPVLGVEPAHNVAAAALAKGVPTEIAFFGRETAARLRDSIPAPDLIVANNVLAHVPDLNDFVSGLKLLLAPGGRITIEFPHLLELIEGNQFDTIYHEHFSYFSFHTVKLVMARHGLRIFDVEELPTHGGSLRIFAGHDGEGGNVTTGAVAALAAREQTAGLDRLATYRKFAASVIETKIAILEFFIAARRAGRTVAGYGAPAKGNTLLNFCGVRADMLAFTVDLSPHKQGMLLPGTRIAVRGPNAIAAARPDYLFILPWNLREEIMAQMSFIRDWGGQFVVPVPRPAILQ